jgi:hypothetical protein
LWDKPQSYATFPGGADLPAKLKVWRVQNSGKEMYGAVSEPFAKGAPADCEVLTTGLSTHKGAQHVSVGRQGNFLYWGYNSPPSQMTEAGKAFYLNCLVYIAKFDKPPLDRSAAGGAAATH